MRFVPNKELPLDLWRPCYAVPEMQAELRPDGLHVTTRALASAYVLKYPLLVAQVAGDYVFEMHYRLVAGEVTFGALNADESRWIATALNAPRDGQLIKTFRLKLAAGEKFVLLLANCRQDGDLASTIVVERVDLPGTDNEGIVFGSKENTAPHHRIFSRFPCPDIAVPAGFSAYFTGSVFRDSLLAPHGATNPARVVSTAYPPFDDEYFEWIALLSAVCAAEGEFTMVELGAGYGRWLMMGAGAARRRKIPCKLIGVEAEPSHFKWMEMCFRDNGLDPADHCLVEAAVSKTEDEVWFYMGHASEWYGQRIAQPSEKFCQDIVPGKVPEGAAVHKVRAVSLDSLLRPLPVVDLIDLDIQGAEAEVLAAATAQLNAKVKMVTVGTHTNPVTFTREIEEAVTEVFRKMNWINIYNFGHGAERETPFGRIKFEDGVQVWVNPTATKLLETFRLEERAFSAYHPTGNPQPATNPT